jgi:hypothetical protein
MPHLLLLVQLLAILPAAGTASTGEPEPLAWMAGCWQLTRGSTVVEEQWLRPRGGVLLGTARTIRQGKLVEYEFVVLRVAGDGATYEAHPSGQDPATFTASRVEPGAVAFENLQHDFPQRVGYLWGGRDSLLAWIEGRANGSTRRIDFPYVRVSCDPE